MAAAVAPFAQISGRRLLTGGVFLGRESNLGRSIDFGHINQRQVHQLWTNFRSRWCLRMRESLLNLRRRTVHLRQRTVNLRRPERARNEGSTGPKRLDDTRCTTCKRRGVLSSRPVDNPGANRWFLQSSPTEMPTPGICERFS